MPAIARLWLFAALRKSQLLAISENSLPFDLLPGTCKSTFKSSAFATSVREPKRFVDVFTVNIHAGQGGSGVSTVWGSKAKGYFQPPDGGNGGPGGDVIVQACSSQRTLKGIKRLVKAGNGGRGQRQKRHGGKGQDLVILVPVGTTVTTQQLPSEADQHTSDWAQFSRPWIGARDYVSSDEEERPQSADPAAAPATLPEVQVADLIEDGQQVCVAQGGRGGKGNAALRSKHRNRPASMEHEEGSPGESCVVHLEMKLIADVGLVGQPNAGKSTLLQALSAARPKIADYPFTTLRPQLGVVKYEDGNSLIVADIPGLIAGAAEQGRGLGHEFLRHIERTRVLAFVVDVSVGGDGSSAGPLEQLTMLEEELRLHSQDLADRPSLVVANKCAAKQLSARSNKL
ncbi:hypothetical protein WJX73_007875 [Symbiochloris irregularis]|uniref:Uncharacterized protein n=1 Tax=Symbiochloris irregularis TaxID=706552 RepID=A0AAW1P6Y3_9CHLO